MNIVERIGYKADNGTLVTEEAKQEAIQTINSLCGYENEYIGLVAALLDFIFYDMYCSYIRTVERLERMRSEYDAMPMGTLKTSYGKRIGRIVEYHQQQYDRMLLHALDVNYQERKDRKMLTQHPNHFIHYFRLMMGAKAMPDVMHTAHAWRTCTLYIIEELDEPLVFESLEDAQSSLVYRMG